MLFGVIEAGGTKMVCGLGNEKGELFDTVSFPTTTPDETIPKLLEFFKGYAIEGIGIGTFGPVFLDQSSSRYGEILDTPKLAWKGFNWVSTFKEAFNVPVFIDTDVNGAALAEVLWGAAKGLKSCVYITIGTGIGMGVYTNGGLVHGLLHPEGGHMILPRHEADHYESGCPFHSDCMEGRAAGPSIEKRFGVKAHLLPKDHLAWELEAHYIAYGLVNLLMLVSPEKIILGGGVMHQEHLFPMIHAKFKEILNGYIRHTSLEENIESYIVEPGIKDISGTYGALAILLMGLKLI